jgi:hypothetical protein
MKHFSQAAHDQAVMLVAQRLGELLQLAPEQVQVRQDVPAAELDALVETPAYTFAVEFKANSNLANIVRGIDQVRSLPPATSRGRGGWHPLIATRYMTPAGRQHCQEAGMSWMDLAGNAHIEGKGLYVHVEGRPNTFKPPGRPSSVFAPKSSRIARWLLIHPDRFFHQRELAQETSMDEGFTSRIVSRLEDERLVRRNKQGQVRVSNPDLLLDAWAEEYDFFKHEVHRSHMSARSGRELVHTANSRLGPLGWDTAATGLAAAWAIHPFAEFRITTLYLKEREARQVPWPSSEPESAGANLWLVLPNDAGVFQGRGVYAEGIACVHPVQVWLDLRAHPERSAEAAEQLRSSFSWRTHAR